MIFTKSVHWKYEREWRYFSKKSGPIQIDDNSIKSVIIGSQMKQENIESFLEIVSKGRHKPDVYQASLDKSNYKVVVSKYKPWYILSA